MAAWTPTNPVLGGKNRPSFWIKTRVTKPVWSKVRGLRQVLKTNDLTESCPEPPFILREPCPERIVHPSTSSGRTLSRRAQDERRVEGDDTGILTVTFGLQPFIF